jgi:Uncharacterised protein family (UPF0158)
MSLPVSLREFVSELDSFHDEWRVFLNRRTGEFLTTTDEDRAAAEAEEDAYIPEWQREVLPKIIEAMTSDDWLVLPSKFEINEYDIMERFCCTLTDEVLRGDLLDTIGGRGTFGRFKNMLYRHNLKDQWYKFRDEALREIAIEWLEANGIPYVE